MTKQDPKKSKRIYVQDWYDPKCRPEELLRLCERLGSLNDDLCDWLEVAEKSSKECWAYVYGDGNSFNCDISYDMIKQIDAAWNLLYDAELALRSVLDQAIIKGLSDKRPLLTEGRTNVNVERSKYIRGL